MGKLNGGEFLLDLTPITIEESTDSETYTNITNAKVLEQLTNLKRYIPNEKAIKPVWVKFVNDETDEIVVVKGELAKTSGDEEFEIHVKTKGYELTIHIEFTQAVNDNSDPIDDWYIDTNDAKYLFLSNAQTIGAISELPVFENIVDKDGNKRFIEGNIATGTITDVIFTYAKWSLSGTHLMIVLAGNATNGANFQGEFALFTIPSFIHNKIVALFGSSDNVAKVNFSMFNDDLSTQETSAYLQKQADNKLRIYVNGITLTKDRQFRIEFDLLIDDE